MWDLFFPVSLHNKNNKKKKQQNKTRLRSSWITVLSSCRFWWLIVHLLLAAKVPSIPIPQSYFFYLSDGFASTFKTIACYLLFFFPVALFSFQFFPLFAASQFCWLINVQVSQDYLYIVKPAHLAIRIRENVCLNLHCSCNLHMPIHTERPPIILV